VFPLWQIDPPAKCLAVMDHFPNPFARKRFVIAGGVRSALDAISLDEGEIWESR
jgi:hypothetical protein